MKLGRWGRAYLAQRRSGEQPPSVLQRARAEYQRHVAALKRDGFEQVGDAWPLWELDRGSRQNHIITDVRIGPDRRSVWVKTSRVTDF